MSAEYGWAPGLGISLVEPLFRRCLLIFFFGYFHFYVAALIVIGMKTLRAKVITVASLYGIAIVANVVTAGLLGWRY
jgi:hypothetical protein